VPALFWYNALLIASNGTESRVGSLTADWERFFEWKRIEREDEPAQGVSGNDYSRHVRAGTPVRSGGKTLLCFPAHKAGLVKILGQNHQFLGVNNAISATVKARSAGHGEAACSGRPRFGQKLFDGVLRPENPSETSGQTDVLVVTDRVELDGQIAKTFAACGAVTDANECHASSGAHLRQLLSENHRYVFTLISQIPSRSTTRYLWERGRGHCH